MARLTLRVQPRASASRIAGYEAGVWQVRVTAPPVEGEANEAVVELLAKCLGVRRGAIAIERGHTRRNKIVSVSGMSDEEADRRLQACAEETRSGRRGREARG